MSAAYSEALSPRFVELLGAFRLEEVPAAVRAHAMLVLLDTVGEMIAGGAASHPTTRILAGLYATGSQGPGTPADSAFINAAHATIGLKDPLHVATSMHAPAVAAAAVLAVAAPERTTGAELLGSFLLGVETACRVSDALGADAMYRRGFHPTAVCGAFGAAVAAVECVGRADTFHAALSLALQHSGGNLIWMRDSSDGSRPLSAAIAARNGVTAMALSVAGLGGPLNPFDGEHSVFSAFSDLSSPDLLLSKWGERFFIAEMTYKLHASCTYTHAALDALGSVLAKNACTPDRIRALLVRVSPSAFPFVTDPSLRSCHAPYILGLRLLDGEVTIENVARGPAIDPRTARLMEVIEIVADPEIAPGGAGVLVRVDDGTEAQEHVSHARGTLACPLSETEIFSKFMRAARKNRSPALVDAILDGIMSLERSTDISGLLHLIRQPAGGVEAHPA
jgi:2-methylcitrate dehydratase PrpD